MKNFLILIVLSLPALAFSETNAEILEEIGVNQPSVNERVCRAYIQKNSNSVKLVSNLPIRYCSHRNSFQDGWKVVALGDQYCFGQIN